MAWCRWRRGELVVAGDAGSGLLRLRDVAEIRREYVDPPAVLMRHDGQAAIGLGISNVLGGNVVEMGDAVKRRLAALEDQRPVGMELNVVSFQSDSVRAAVSSFVDNLVAAVAIVVVVLLLFMGLRSGLIIGAVLVLTVAGTLIAMWMDGIAMQRISLGALIIALGMLVDNAIVVTDGILVRLQKGEAVAPAAGAAVRATVWPLLGGTVVGILAFSAIGLSPTDMGEYAGSLFWVILYSMLLSWLFAITLTPLLCAAFLKVKVRRRTCRRAACCAPIAACCRPCWPTASSAAWSWSACSPPAWSPSAMCRPASCPTRRGRSSWSTWRCRRAPTSARPRRWSPRPRARCVRRRGCVM